MIIRLIVDQILTLEEGVCGGIQFGWGLLKHFMILKIHITSILAGKTQKVVGYN